MSGIMDNPLRWQDIVIDVSLEKRELEFFTPLHPKNNRCIVHTSSVYAAMQVESFDCRLNKRPFQMFKCSEVEESLPQGE